MIKKLLVIFVAVTLFAGAVIMTDLGTPVRAFASELSQLLAVIATVDSNVDAILVDTGTTLDNLIDTEITTIDGIVDDVKDGNWQHISVTTGLQSVDSTWSSVATHELFTISGAIEYVITIHCDVSYTGSDSLTFLFAGQTPFTAIAKVDADAGEILSIITDPVAGAAYVKHEVDPTVGIAPTDPHSLIKAQYKGVSMADLDFGYQIEIGSAPAGQLTASMRWRSIDLPTAAVAAGAGGSL